MYQFRNEHGIMKIYDTRTHNLYWLDKPADVIKVVELLNEKPAEQLADLTRRLEAAEREKEINFFDGLRAGVTRFAWWKNGVQYVGTTGKTLKLAYEEIRQEEIATLKLESK